MQINRLFEIIYILLDKERVTAQELTEHFEVSPRTMHRESCKVYLEGWKNQI